MVTAAGLLIPAETLLVNGFDECDLASIIYWNKLMMINMRHITYRRDNIMKRGVKSIKIKIA